MASPKLRTAFISIFSPLCTPAHPLSVDDTGKEKNICASSSLVGSLKSRSAVEMVAMFVGETCDVSQEMCGLVKPAPDAGELVATFKARSGQETNQCKEGTRLPFLAHRQAARSGRLKTTIRQQFADGFPDER